MLPLHAPQRFAGAGSLARSCLPAPRTALYGCTPGLSHAHWPPLRDREPSPQWGRGRGDRGPCIPHTAVATSANRLLHPRTPWPPRQSCEPTLHPAQVLATLHSIAESGPCIYRWGYMDRIGLQTQTSLRDCVQSAALGCLTSHSPFLKRCHGGKSASEEDGDG